MDDKGWSLFRRGLRRRRKEVLRLRFMMGLAVFLTAFVLLFQDNINAYVMQNNYRSYGKWLLRAEKGSEALIPYLDWETVSVGGSVNRLYELAPEVIDLDGEIPDAEPVQPSEPEEQLILPENENSRRTSIRIGVLEEDFAEENGVGLYEGRLPQAPGEIAMVLEALQELGLSYELGQEVSFYVAEPVEQPDPASKEPAMVTLNRVRFTLCGTLEHYTSRWNAGNDLPGVLICRQDYDSLVMDRNEYVFGMLKPEYVTKDVWRFAEELIRDAAEANPALVTNEAAYFNPFWGDPALYRGMIIVLMILSVSLVAYLISGYLEKRRKYFLRIREIGASSAEVWKMAAYECSLSVIPAVIIGIAAAYAASAGAVLLMTTLGKADFFYLFYGDTFLRILLCVAATFGLALLAALLIYSGRGASEKRRGMPKGTASGLRRRALRSRAPEPGYRETLRREQISHPFRTAFRRVAVVIVCAVLLYSFDRIESSGRGYRLHFAPFSGNAMVTVNRTYKVPKGAKGTQKYETGTMRSMLRKPIPDAFFVELAEKPGVASFYRRLSDGFRTVSWEGKEENDAWRAYLEEAAEETVGSFNKENSAVDAFLQRIDQSLFSVSARENAEAAWTGSGLKKDAPYYQEYLEGNAVIIEADSSFMESAGLAVGDTLRLPGKNGELELKVAAVSETVSPMKQITLYGSGELGKKLQELEDAAGCWNEFVVAFNDLSDRENTAKALAELCVRYGLNYTSMAEEIQAMEATYLRTMITYGFFSLTLFILFLFMAFSITADRELRLQEKRDLMRKLGTEEKIFSRERRKEAVREALWGLAALPPAIGAKYYLVWNSLGSQQGERAFYSKLLMRDIIYRVPPDPAVPGDTRGLTALVMVLEQTEWIWWLIPLVLAILFTALAFGLAGNGDDHD